MSDTQDQFLDGLAQACGGLHSTMEARLGLWDSSDERSQLLRLIRKTKAQNGRKAALLRRAVDNAISQPQPQGLRLVLRDGRLESAHYMYAAIGLRDINLA